MFEQPIQIVRYPNRRFYARDVSKYVSLQEIEELVQAGKTVDIRDSQTGEELTRSVLTRIIMERQPEKMALFPTDMLHFILRSNALTAGFLRDYLRQSLTYLEYLQRHNAAASTVTRPISWVKAWLDGLGGSQPAAKTNGSAAETGAADHTGPGAEGVARPDVAPAETPSADNLPADRRVQEGDAWSGPVAADLARSALVLAQRVEELESRIRQLEAPPQSKEETPTEASSTEETGQPATKRPTTGQQDTEKGQGDQSLP